MEIKGSFKAVNNKGFHITFPNGVTLSTQFGPYNYCGDYPDTSISERELNWDKNRGSDDAEIALWDKNGEWITKEYIDNGDDVIGYVDIEDWLKVFDWARNYKEEK